MANERTLILIKPDGLQRGLAGEIISRLERTGLQLAGMKLMQVSDELAQRHYAEHEGKPFFDGLVRFITSSPVIAMCIAGPNAIATVRKIMGATDPAEAAPGTIRGDLGIDVGRNLIHGSANQNDAAREVGLFFEESELLAYKRSVRPWIIE